MSDKPCVSCGFMRTCYYCKEADKPAIDLEACAMRAFWAHSRALTKGHGAWEDVQGKNREAWLAVAAAVLEAAGVK